MKFDVIKTNDAEKEYSALSQEQRELLDNDYKIIKNDGIEFVFVKHIEDKIFEIKTKNIRSLFIYEENQIIIVGLIFIKKTQKTPDSIKKTAKKRFKKL